MTDVAIADLLADHGFRTGTERDLARAALEAAGLTNPRKQAFSETKLPRVRALLAARFAFACDTCANTVRNARPGAELLAVDGERCEHCGGSDHHAAALRFLSACLRHRVRRLVVVGGNPATRQALTRHLVGLEVQLIDGTRALSARRARQLLDWADLVLVWGNTQLDHRVSTLFTAARDRKVVAAAKRGISGLLDAGTTHLVRDFSGAPEATV